MNAAGSVVQEKTEKAIENEYNDSVITSKEYPRNNREISQPTGKENNEPIECWVHCIMIDNVTLNGIKIIRDEMINEMQW